MHSGQLVLDTNVVSYLMKNHPFARQYVKELSGKTLFISFITVGELYLWAEIGDWGTKRRDALDAVLRNYVIIPYDHEIARYYARVVAERTKSGRPISLHDAWIAATALRHDVPLVTHNSKDFTHISALNLITSHD